MIHIGRASYRLVLGPTTSLQSRASNKIKLFAVLNKEWALSWGTFYFWLTRVEIWGMDHTQGIEMWITMAGLFQFETIMKVHGEKAGIWKTHIIISLLLTGS